MAFKLLKREYSVVRSRVYRGFLIEILDNAYFGDFRYEYRITALKNGVMVWRKPNHYSTVKTGDVFTDQTSMTRIKRSMWYAKDHVDGLCQPIFIHHMGY